MWGQSFFVCDLAAYTLVLFTSFLSKAQNTSLKKSEGILGRIEMFLMKRHWPNDL